MTTKVVQKALLFGIIELMKKQFNHTYYCTNTRNIQLKFDEFFAEKEIPANGSVRRIDKIVEEMDLSSLLSTDKRTGRPVIRRKFYMGPCRKYSLMLVWKENI